MITHCKFLLCAYVNVTTASIMQRISTYAYKLDQNLRSHTFKNLTKYHTMGGGGAMKPMEGADGMSTFEKAKKRALRGGITGAAAQGVNVLALMWLRTTMNYQMANGGGMMQTIKLLYKEGGYLDFTAVWYLL